MPMTRCAGVPDYDITLGELGPMTSRVEPITTIYKVSLAYEARYQGDEGKMKRGGERSQVCQ